MNTDVTSMTGIEVLALTELLELRGYEVELQRRRDRIVCVFDKHFDPFWPPVKV